MPEDRGAKAVNRGRIANLSMTQAGSISLLSWNLGSVHVTGVDLLFQQHICVSLRSLHLLPLLIFK
jgi:hypothetical protein